MTVLELNESDGNMKKTGTTLSLTLLSSQQNENTVLGSDIFLVRNGSIHCQGKHMVRFVSESRNEFQFCWMYSVTWIRI